MAKTKELRIYTEPEPPTNEHLGWVTLVIDDIHDLFTKMEFYLFKCFLFAQEEDKFSDLAGRDMTDFLKSGGIVDYKEKYFNIDFIFPLSQKDINSIKNRAKETVKCISKKEEPTFQLSPADAIMLKSIIEG